ncbi:glycosyltransferase family 39 protein [Thiohalocapsa marina]|uniref:Glycosyltransferase family 39 protein n=1 Tax=Thiohalocapsa marina TaxID=424902 RepID=A0A5M8FH45_9GAMM|nr:glycosyltransferase family 39 protein [Thiohalocapsa marina]KAA6184047.1 glycosyltransferase family 39 protein [Thiohalocapsa marina]
MQSPAPDTVAPRIGPTAAPGLDHWRWPWLLLLGLTTWRLLIAATVPVTQDEAYYFNWARSLAWGYFDHPPGVALIGIGTLLAPGSAFAARLGAVLCGTLSFLVMWRLYRACGLHGRELLLALVIATATFPGLVAGVVTTPDTVLYLFWLLALHESLAALQGRRQRWITAGIACGLGLLGKYTMVIIGPVLLLAILLIDPRALRTRWPYLGAALALLLFLPHLLWNAQHDWLTMRFQFGHGFSTDTGAIALAADRLPAAVGLHAYQPAAPEPMDLGQRLGSLGEYLGSQLLFWGALLLPLAAAPFATGGLAGMRRRLRETLPTPARRLLLIGLGLPLLFFGTVAWFSEVEANWSVLYLVCAAPLAAVALRPLSRWLVAAAAVNLLLLSLYALHAATAVLPLPHAAERILRETHGYAALAEHIADLPGPVFTDRYPYAAMLNFYRPDIAATQWPGITRPSEYGRGSIVPIPALQDLQDQGFWLLARKFSAPDIPGFTARQDWTLIDCGGHPLQITQGPAGEHESSCGDQWQHIWRLYRYEWGYEK